MVWTEVGVVGPAVEGRGDRDGVRGCKGGHKGRLVVVDARYLEGGAEEGGEQGEVRWVGRGRGCV